MDTFFELLQIAVGTRESLTAVPSTREEWEELFTVAGKHNLLGVTFPVIDTLHDQVDVPLGIYSRWAMVEEQVEKKNEMHRKACAYLSERFLANGFRSCILKGQAAAALYPRPELRQSGDVDIWVDGGRKAIVDFLRSRVPVKKIVYHHCDAPLFKGVSVEVHFTPTWMNAPLRNRRLQKYFADNAGQQFSNFDSSLGCNVPTLRFDAVYMLIHIYRHVLEEGIGLRQLLDYYYVLKALPAHVCAEVTGDLRKLGMTGFAAGVKYVLQEVFAAPASLFPIEADKRLGGFLLDEILRSGNFGRYDPRNAHAAGEGKIAHTRRKVTRALRFLRFFPGEVICMPFFMLWQYLWRRRNNYLYKGR